MLRWRQPLPALLRLFSTSCRRHSRLPTPPHPPSPNTLLQPPVARKAPFTVSPHGRSWSDPYHWMRDTSDPDLAALLTAKNADDFVAEASGGGLRARLAAEMHRLPPSVASPPQPWGPLEPKELGDLDPWFFPIPSNLCSILPGPNNGFMSSTYRLVVSSPVTPDLTVDYDMRKKTFTILHQEEVTGLSSSVCTVGLQSNVSSFQQNLQLIEDSQSWSDLSKLFYCERVQVISHDGVSSISLVILYSREAQRHGESPGILYGYGAYGEDLDKSWCSDRLSLLARGAEGIHHGIWQAPKLTR